jgi:hypothetical protein
MAPPEQPLGLHVNDRESSLISTTQLPEPAQEHRKIRMRLTRRPTSRTRICIALGDLA